MLAGMIEDRRLTAKEEHKWRAEFKALGREAVRARSPAFQPHIKRDLAVRWLREQELAAERRERGTFWIAVAILVLTVVGKPRACPGLAASFCCFSRRRA